MNIENILKEIIKEIEKRDLENDYRLQDVLYYLENALSAYKGYE